MVTDLFLLAFIRELIVGIHTITNKKVSAKEAFVFRKYYLVIVVAKWQMRKTQKLRIGYYAFKLPFAMLY